jgi:hypothetical protein
MPTLKPEQIWVSGSGEEHPSRDFLEYLRRQHSHFPFRLRATNTNADLDAMRSGAIPIETLTVGPISTEF